MISPNQVVDAESSILFRSWIELEFFCIMLCNFLPDLSRVGIFGIMHSIQVLWSSGSSNFLAHRLVEQAACKIRLTLCLQDLS